nr:hypothetical protein [uncultured Pseudomonas sp.]
MNIEKGLSPLTLIAIFAGIVEASALASLPFLSENSQLIYTWFLVGFPFFLTVLFFLTLNFNHQTLYQPPAHEAAQKQPTIETERMHGQASATIAFSGPDAGELIEQHIHRTLADPATSAHSWTLYNLDAQKQIYLAVETLATTPQSVMFKAGGRQKKPRHQAGVGHAN